MGDLGKGAPIPSPLGAFGVSILGASSLVSPLFRSKLCPCKTGYFGDGPPSQSLG